MSESSSRKITVERKTTRHGRARGALVGSLLVFFTVAFPAFPPVQAASTRGRRTVEEYSARLKQAKQGIDDVIERESPAPSLINRLRQIERLLPVNEDVESGGALIHVNNAWLHDALDKVIQNAGGDIEQRHSMLREISDGLANLERSVNGAQIARGQPEQDQREKLNGILARSEYRPEQIKDSWLQSWFGKIKDFLARLLRGFLRFLQKLFGRPSGQPAQPGGSGLISVFRMLVLLALIVALVFGGRKLARQLGRRKKVERKAAPREILGEEMAEEATAADLFAEASDLARRGEYRKAIRRTYVALLCDLEQRGKLRLHRSKTNRDYLEAMRPEPQIYPKFSVITNSFEHVWYGQEVATQEEFDDFVALYRETVK
jgi:hypothetical protein